MSVFGAVCFITLWIYTILKRQDPIKYAFARFITLWIYTILKPGGIWKK